MPLILQDVVASDFPTVMACLWDAFENPEQHLFRLFCPMNPVGAVAGDRASALKECTDRFWEWHVSDPGSYWQKVIDTERPDEVAGAALWKLNTKNPYEEPEHHTAYWHPEGGQREFASQAVAQHEAVREKWARRGHVFLNIIFMHPSYQGRGGARPILEWGVKKAAEMGVEMWLDAFRYGKPVYELFGFTVVQHNRLKPATEDPDEAWKKCEREWSDLDEWIMWRPKDGPYVEGYSVKPWEVGL